MDRINVTKTFLPPQEEYESYLERIWQNGQVTNQGPLLHDFEQQVSTYLGVKNFHFVTNGTLALQLALRALHIEGGEVITTPFSYVATTSAILWEQCTPVYVDIEPNTFCIDADKIEAAITEKTKAILAVHVFGYPCDVKKIQTIADKHNLKVIYDGAHIFGSKFEGKSLFDYGDITIGSFHATKPFHTIEGGCLVVRDASVSESVELMKRFGHNFDDHVTLGINAKASEFQAAMGLCNLNYIQDIIARRKAASDHYTALLQDRYQRPKMPTNLTYNYAYYPIVFEDEKVLLKMQQKLQDKNVYPRRYFYPSLNTLPYVSQQAACPISEDIASRILCLPLYDSLEADVIRQICEVLTA